MTIANSVALSKVDGYITEDFTKADVQVLADLPVLCSLVGPNHALWMDTEHPTTT